MGVKTYQTLAFVMDETFALLMNHGTNSRTHLSNTTIYVEYHKSHEITATSVCTTATLSITLNLIPGISANTYIFPRKTRLDATEQVDLCSASSSPGRCGPILVEC